MALADTLTGSLRVRLEGRMARTSGTGGMLGEDALEHDFTQQFTDGTSANQAQIWLTGIVAVTTGGITISLADSADPFSTGGDDVPTADPEGKKLRAIVIQNLDTTNYVSLAEGTNAITSWLGGTTPTVRIPASGILAATMPAGLDALTDGTDDEIKLTANTATCNVRVSALFG